MQESLKFLVYFFEGGHLLGTEHFNKGARRKELSFNNQGNLFRAKELTLNPTAVASYLKKIAYAVVLRKRNKYHIT